MKKTLVSALTTALVVGAASTTFAAANPFEDVAADHWAYDAVAQLAADGVIEGYGDGTYRGDQEITRYEMAQMVARAMAKSGVSAADKAMIDKLAAEFADELNALGVRVAALEKKVDNVKWTGRVRYRYINKREENKANDPHKNTNQVLLRLEPTMQINKHWVGKARIDYGQSDNMDSAKNDTKATVDRIYVVGTYGNTQINLGKFPEQTQADYGMIFDYRMAGGKVVFGKDIKVGLAAGRLNLNDAKGFGVWGRKADGTTTPVADDEVTASVLNVEVYNDRAKKFTWGVGYTQVANKQDFRDKNPRIWNVGLGYKFTPTFNVTAAYARNTHAFEGTESKNKTSYNIQLNYKGAKASQKGSFGLFLGYRHLGNLSTVRSTYSENGGIEAGQKGFEVGASYTFDKNIVGKAQYFWGKKIAIDDNNKVHALWTELSFLF
ncbi:S-layer homology domain-containing protein [Schwartzia succinivorans]|jgi:hypothetical protein|uniref:S-layer homology domain-containing protein n=1 Tax=Schwartzia succinivorans DSM 10502 TaxID=1123243 RepID=A0A1M4TB29_9FIRM|nr:S-layer homology domain-containing protein [Schwartzia succinivorans]SHE41706.1 S-layer homology domain-containing protein [Schwartzia succinivorans DSM 10502]